jgi:hypothetical protein
MEKLIYNIADLNICMEIPFQLTISEESKPFLKNGETDCDTHVELIPVDALPPMTAGGIWRESRYFVGESFYIRSEPQKNIYMLVEYRENCRIRIAYLRDSNDMAHESSYLLNMLGLEKLLLCHRALILHASFIRWQGQGILFSAPSGTGKSTQASLWETHMGAKILNGDRAGIRYADGAWRAYGLPYAGSSRIFQNGSAPIRAIVVLKQGQENRIRPMGPMEALRALLPEFSAHRWDPVFMDKLLNVAAGLLRDVPVYCLECRPDSEAVQLLHNTLFNEERL